MASHGYGTYSMLSPFIVGVKTATLRMMLSKPVGETLRSQAMMFFVQKLWIHTSQG